MNENCRLVQNGKPVRSMEGGRVDEDDGSDRETERYIHERQSRNTIDKIFELKYVERILVEKYEVCRRSPSKTQTTDGEKRTTDARTRR